MYKIYNFEIYPPLGRGRSLAGMAEQHHFPVPEAGHVKMMRLRNTYKIRQHMTCFYSTSVGGVEKNSKKISLPSLVILIYLLYSILHI
jgi:hypothetical protein